MKLSKLSIALSSALMAATTVTGFVPSPSSFALNSLPNARGLSVCAAPQDIDLENASAVGKLSFRELQSACKEKGLPAVGNTVTLRNRLLETLPSSIEESESATDSPSMTDFDFKDESDPDFEFNALVNEIDQKVSLGHWKAAIRKLKKLRKRHATPERPVPQETYVKVLEVCLEDRLHGARASEPARKILEEMAEIGYDIRADLGNECISNCIGNGPNGTHDSFGGVDTALAMLAAMESSPKGSEMITVDSYGAVVSALSREGSVDEALLLLRAMVVEHSFTPPLSTFDDAARAAAKSGDHSEGVLQVLTLVKASGYILDSIASAEAGRGILASGVIAAEQMGNLALGLRLLTAAGKAEGCAPDTGDDLVCSSSSDAQRASTLIHKRAIDKALEDDNWKLAVKLLELMQRRSLTPSTSVWRKVVTLCSKAQKSRKAVALLFDWITLSEQGKAEKPLLKVFNTVVNACEHCKEEALTVSVLEKMKEVHQTDGNIITLNIALKRLAKLGLAQACEGIIISMLDEGLEPNVVSYTTAIAACLNAKDSASAYEWLNRMRSRNVNPNFHTYNTALAACLDGKLESTARASTIANEMMADVGKELMVGYKGAADYTSVIPDKYTKVLARSLMKQLRENWRTDEINIAVAKSTLRVPLLKLVDFEKSEAAAEIEKVKVAASALQATLSADGEDMQAVENAELDVDFKDNHRRIEV